MNDHPTPAELEGFVWNRVSPERGREVASHLIRGCQQCCAAVAPHLEGLFGVGEPPECSLSSHEEAEYEAALDRAFTAAQRSGKLREKSPLLDPSVEGLPEISEQLRRIPVLQALLERSWALRYENPGEMLLLAKRACLLTEELNADGLGETFVADLHCRALMELGNAYRVADDLAAAESALGEAAKQFPLGSQDELLAARLFDVQASLYGDQRRFDLAQAALDMVFAIYRRRGERHLAGRALISKGAHAANDGESEEAIRLITQGLELVDEDREPRLIFLAFHNLARLFVDCGRHRDARIALFRLRARGLDPGGRIAELKVRWLEGQINAGLGEFDRAEQALLEVRAGFEEADLGYKAALAGLELGAVMLRRGRTGAARKEVLQAADVFIALGIHRETAASVLLLRKAFERETLDSVLLEHVIALLHRAEAGGDLPNEAAP